MRPTNKRIKARSDNPAPGSLSIPWNCVVSNAVKNTTIRTEYVPVPQEVIVETVPYGRPIPADYDPRRPIGDAIVTTQNIRQGPYDTYGARAEPIIVRDVVIRDDQPPMTYGQQYPHHTRVQEHSFPVNIESTHTTYRT